LQKVDSVHGLITTVAYKIGQSPAIYALEGSVAVAGAALSWLQNNMQLLDIRETQQMAERVASPGDVYFVPAFSGLYAPYWQQDARGYYIHVSFLPSSYLFVEICYNFHTIKFLRIYCTLDIYITSHTYFVYFYYRKNIFVQFIYIYN